VLATSNLPSVALLELLSLTLGAFLVVETSNLPSVALGCGDLIEQLDVAAAI
jgi:hypothetical protein